MPRSAGILFKLGDVFRMFIGPIFVVALINETMQDAGLALVMGTFCYFGQMAAMALSDLVCDIEDLLRRRKVAA